MSPYLGFGMLKLALLLVVLYALYLGAACGLARSIVFPGPVGEAAALPSDVEVWRVHHAEGVTPALFLLGQGRSASSPGPALFFFHGNAERADQWVETLRAYQRAGFSVLIFEYRGYPGADGSPAESALIDDAVALSDQLRARPEVDGARIVVHGRSLGAGVMMGLVEKRPPAAVVLQSTFTSLAAPARTFLVPGWALPDQFDNHARLAAYPGPSLIVHGEHDTLLDVGQARTLASAAQDARLSVHPCGHNDCPFSFVMLDVEGFLKERDLWPEG